MDEEGHFTAPMCHAVTWVVWCGTASALLLGERRKAGNLTESDQDKSKIIFFSVRDRPETLFWLPSYDRLLGDLPESCCSFPMEAIVFYVVWQEQHGGRKRAYVSEALVRRRLRPALLLVIGPVKVLARVTCRTTRQKKSAISHRFMSEGEHKLGAEQATFCISAPHHVSVKRAGPAELPECPFIHPEGNASAPPAPISAFPFENFMSLFKSNKIYTFSLFSLSSDHLSGFNKPVATKKCYCLCFPCGASHGALSPSFRYLKDGAVEQDIKGNINPSAGNRRRPAQTEADPPPVSYHEKNSPLFLLVWMYPAWLTFLQLSIHELNPTAVSMLPKVIQEPEAQQENEPTIPNS